VTSAKRLGCYALAILLAHGIGLLGGPVAAFFCGIPLGMIAALCSQRIRRREENRLFFERMREIYGTKSWNRWP